MSIFKKASIMPISRAVVSQGLEDFGVDEAPHHQSETQSENHIREKKRIEDIEWYLQHQKVSPEIIQEVVYRIKFRFAN